MKWTEKINFKNKNLNFFSFDFFNPTLKFFFLPYFLSSKSNRKHVFKKRKSYVTRISSIKFSLEKEIENKLDKGKNRIGVLL